VTIKSFKTEFRLAGGLNLPKIIDCVGSDGKERRQLVKVRLPVSGIVFRGLMPSTSTAGYLILTSFGCLDLALS
jgi:hypothetical protein